MTESKRTLLVTSALLYANGPLHLGHLVEYLQTDIWVRFQRQRGHDVLYVCGNDAHGTPIMLKAQEEDMTPEALVDKIHKEHVQDFAGFLIDFDIFYSTHSPENKKFSESFYNALKARGDISTRTIEQAFDPIKNMFLPDRFVKGECPKCHAGDQYGDNCDACGATYDPTDLINPVSAISGATPELRESEHYFFALNHYQDFLKEWTASDAISPAIANKLKEWLDGDLQAWDISRDAPYFGFEIPGAPNKYFYVWLDAPIGYMSIFEKLCESRPELDFNRYWGPDSDVELYHFIGKDVMYFHTLFWPAMLSGAGYRGPTAVFVHGFLTVNGQKMSKSRGTFIRASDYLEKLNPECLRYYYAAKLNSSVEDIDLNFEDFKVRVNSDLVGKVINIASRTAKFINKNFEGKLATTLDDEALFTTLSQAESEIADYYEAREFSRAVRKIMELADLTNQYIDREKPWILAKDADKMDKVQLVCTQGLNLYRLLILYLKPILPKIAAESETFLAIPELTWEDAKQPLLGHTIDKFKPLMQRVVDIEL